MQIDPSHETIKVQLNGLLCFPLYGLLKSSSTFVVKLLHTFFLFKVVDFSVLITKLKSCFELVY